MKGKRLLFSRRRFLITSALGLGAVFVGAYGYSKLGPLKKKLMRAGHVQGPPDDSPFDPDILEAVAIFTGAVFGHELSRNDREELVGRLKFATQEDSGWREEYSWLKSHVDQVARELGASGFKSTSALQRNHLVTRVMQKRTRSGYSRWLAMVSSEERNRRRMHKSTFRHLFRLYRQSGVPWRLRGYTSWPGVPGDAREYTRPGPVRSC